MSKEEEKSVRSTSSLRKKSDGVMQYQVEESKYYNDNMNEPTLDPLQAFGQRDTIDMMQNEVNSIVGDMIQNRDDNTESSIQASNITRSLGTGNSKNLSQVHPQDYYNRGNTKNSKFQSKRKGKGKMYVKQVKRFQTKKAPNKRMFDIDDMLDDANDLIRDPNGLEQINENDDEDQMPKRKLSLKMDDFKSKYKKHGISKTRVKKIITHNYKPNYAPSTKKFRREEYSNDFGNSGYFNKNMFGNIGTKSDYSNSNQNSFGIGDRFSYGVNLNDIASKDPSSEIQKPKKSLIKGLASQVYEKSNIRDVGGLPTQPAKIGDSYDDLKFGSTILISISRNKKNAIDDGKDKRLSIRLRTSEKIKPFEMEAGDYDINCLFKILPASQYTMQEKILNIVEEDEIGDKIEIDYENFVSEIESNTANYNLSMNQSINFGSRIQLYHDSSKRFLCYYTEKLEEIRDAFDNKYSDSEGFYLGFSEYPSENTHFSFETVPAYQQEEDGFIKAYHYLYLTCMEKGKKHYLFCISELLKTPKCLMTESYRTPLRINVIRNYQEQKADRNIGRSDVVLISFANDKFYLNCPQELDEHSGEFKEAGIQFHRWKDAKNIDFNGWWQIEITEESKECKIRNFNNGKYLKAQKETYDGQYPIMLVESSEEASSFEFALINSDRTDISSITEKDIFKIKLTDQRISKNNYICIEGNDEEDDYLEDQAFSDTKSIKIGEKYDVNTFDSFKIIIPKQDEYMELSLCLDSREYVDLFFSRLIKSNDVQRFIAEKKDALATVLIQLLEFMLNKLKGKTRPEYRIGQIIPHRQEMVSKVGILQKMFSFLEIANGMFTEESKEEILDLFELDDFENFDNLLEVVIKAIHVAMLDHSGNTRQSSYSLSIIQNFVFVEGCSSLLIDIFKDKSFELNKKEIHSELFYRRIFEIQRFEKIIDHFTELVKTKRDPKYLLILRKMCIIDRNPLPLVQEEIFKRLYQPEDNKEDVFETKFEIKIDDKDGQNSLEFEGGSSSITILYTNSYGSNKISLKEFLEDRDYDDNSDKSFLDENERKEISFFLEQISLEADLCFGRNKLCKNYFRKIYPCHWLIENLQDDDLDKDFRGKLIRLLYSIYIDDPPHKLLKMERSFKAYQSNDKYIEKISSNRNADLKSSLLDNLVKYIKEYMKAFAKSATGVNYLKEFDMEFIRLLNYLMRYGLFIYRNKTFQSKDIHFMFSYLCHICDLFTAKNYITSKHLLDKIISKDTILTDASKMNPVQKAAYDIKYQLFNKDFSSHETQVEEIKLEDMPEEERVNAKKFSIKVLVEIVNIFHLFNDLRQQYLISNNIEYFYNNIFEPYHREGYLTFNDSDFVNFNNELCQEFVHIVPDSKDFHNHLTYVLPDLDVMYEENNLDKYKVQIISQAAIEIMKQSTGPISSVNKLSIGEIHDEFVALMIDTFNLHSYDPFLRQLIILLIARYQSERAEFVRNLDRTILFFDQSDYLFYNWLLQQLELFVFNSEKSNIWLMNIKQVIFGDKDDQNYEITQELIDLKNILRELKCALVYNCEIVVNEDDKYSLNFTKGERKISFYAQNLYRNTKVYDYLINFLFQNKELLIKVRSINIEELDDGQKEVVSSIKQIFRKIFRVLELMTTKNPKTQELMWKYKEVFVFEDLGSIEQDGELEFVLEIIDDSEDAIKYHQNKWTLTKTKQFVNSLNQRINNNENFVLILEIYNKLIKFESISFLKQSLTKLIMNKPEDIHSYDKETRREYEKAQDLQEIIYNIIRDQEKVFTRDFLAQHFPLKEAFQEITDSIERLDQIEQEKTDNRYDSQDYDDLRDYQYVDLLNIYSQLYFHPKYSKITKSQLEECMTSLTQDYIQKLIDFNNKSDFDRPETIHKSELKFTMVYLKYFFDKMERYYKLLVEKDLTARAYQTTSFREDFPRRNNIGELEALKARRAEIEELRDDIYRKIEGVGEDKYQEVINSVNNWSQTDPGSTKRTSLTEPLKVNKANMKRITIIEERNQNNNRSKLSFTFTKIWRTYVHTISTKRNSRIIVDQEHQDFAKLMFNTLTSKTSHQILIQSYKTFISTSIDYVFSCEKANWNLYIIVFIFKLNSMLLKLSGQEMRKPGISDMKKMIESNILDSVDTLRTSSMIFRILSSSKDDNFCYSNEIFNITAYFCNKLIELRPESLQNKFLGFFKTDSTSEHFFNQCYEYIQVHMDKLEKGTLRHYYSRHKYTDELANNCYLVDKNLEKQVVSLVKNFCAHENKEMQNYMRDQSNNTKNYNLVKIITEYSGKFLTHLQYPVAYDIFQRTLDCLMEFNRGPNEINQEIIIQKDFISVANEVLKMEYKADEEVKENTNKQPKLKPSKDFSLLEQNTESKFNPSLTKGSTLKKSSISASRGDTALPQNNFMISMIKHKSLLILLQLLVGRSRTSYVYYTLRRILDPDVFRKNLAYQSYFIKRFHKNEYSLKLFFRYNIDVDTVNNSPLIIEIGFQLYFLLMKMASNLAIDMDDKYYNRLLRFITLRETKSYQHNEWLILDFVYFCKAVFDIFASKCKKTENLIQMSEINKIAESNNEIRRILRFLSQNVSQIEIFVEGQSLTQFFPILPYCKFNSELPKKNFREQVDRTNAKTKCDTLMRESVFIIDNLKVNYWLKKGLTRFVGLCQEYLDMLKAILSLLGLVINAIILFSYSINVGGRTDDPVFSDTTIESTEGVLLTLGIISLILVLITSFLTSFNILAQHYKKYKVNLEDGEKRRNEKSKSERFTRISPGFNGAAEFATFVFHSFTDWRIVYHILLFLITLTGVVYHPFFYPILLTVFIYRRKALVDVLKAIVKPYESLLLTILLMFMVIYAFTVYSYTYYHADYTDNDCYSLWTCFLISFDNTFKNDGGLGGYLSSAYERQTDGIDVAYGRVIFDNLVFFVVGILLIEIISGLIIDTFADYRQQNNEIENDCKKFCFMCDRTREELEKDLGVDGFRFHTHNQHYMWDYIFFVAYLGSKHEREGQIENTTERYVYDKIQEDDNSWLPCYNE